MCLTSWESPFRRPRQPNAQPMRATGKALIYADEAQRIARFVCEYPDIETGGDLFGYWTHSGAPVVSYAIGPGRGSRHYPMSFYQDADWLHDVGTRLYDQHGLQHVGEWHSHHLLGTNRPSEGDIRTVVRGIAAKDWAKFLLMIATLDPRPNSPVLQNYYLVYPNSYYRPLRILVLDGASPFRSGQEDPREEPIRQPDTDVHWQPGPMTPLARRAAAAFPGAWFATDLGKAQLRQIVADLKSKGLAGRFHFSNDRRGLRLRLPDAELLLAANFPASPPLVLSGPRPNGLSWSPSTNLVDWYLEAWPLRRLARHTGQHHQTTGGSAATEAQTTGAASDV